MKERKIFTKFSDFYDPISMHIVKISEDGEPPVYIDGVSMRNRDIFLHKNLKVGDYIFYVNFNFNRFRSNVNLQTEMI